MTTQKPKTKRSKAVIIKDIKNYTNVFNEKPLERTDCHNLEAILNLLKQGVKNG
tara:strand:- start:514 stop:675 length:162 start_codon:yes stop_codon:yes gene_type:complete